MALYKIHLVCLTIMLVRYAKGNIPAESSSLQTVSGCSGGSNTISPACSPGSKIAITSYHDGFKAASLNCDLTGNAVGSCCTYDAAGDCLQEAPTETRYVDEFSGKDSGVISTSTVGPTTGGAYDNSSYSAVSVFHEMDYLCIPDIRISRMCTSVYRKRMPLPLYLQNRNYPNGIITTDTRCTCSVEALSGGSIDMYIVHMDLYDTPGDCQQTLTITDVDGNVLRAFNCDSEEFNSIKKETLSTNYMEITLNNNYVTNAGKFWLGFQGQSDTDIVVNCPASMIKCRNPSTIPYGSVLYASTRYGSIATYSCNTGHNMTPGDDVRYCGADEEWNGTEPACAVVDCGNLTQITNGNVSHETTDYKSTAIYTCYTGYEITTGITTRTCQADGTWSGAEPTCSKEGCFVPVVPFGFFTNGQEHASIVQPGTQIHASCNIGYRLSRENNTLMCRFDLSWDNSLPSCVRIMCEPLILQNGTYTYTQSDNDNMYAFESIATPACGEGFKLQGTRQRVCQADESWSGEEPTCTVVTCNHPGQFEHGHYIKDTTMLRTNDIMIYNSIVKAVCEEGFSLTSGQIIRRCSGHGNWTGTTPICDPIRCNALHNTTAASFRVLPDTTGTYPFYGSTVIWGCTDTVLELQTCTENGTWTGHVPLCQADVCSETTQGGLIASIICNILLVFIVIGLLARLIFIEKKYKGLVQQSALYMDLADTRGAKSQETVYTDLSEETQK